MRNAGRFVTIRIPDELADGYGRHWNVPRGFGAAYRAHARSLERPDVLRNLLELVGWTAKPAEIEKWPPYRRVEAAVYAWRVHLRAGDNPIPVPPRPSWFPEPWRGPSRDPVLNPSPTPLPAPP